ncbi:4-hydroxybenzoate 3-monooxygenase [Brevibacterium sp. BRM-1]|uniref:4-hydroxybenzoate 3-monooxygenase n=1 Tax=Brevibacterium sp. BRM-1 TaxID=2999062 RepID=UPI00227DFF3A|nr:4-hydroxybenzoate 3-monooxygenase [Brevibacterium sp. BRM-1]WAL41671.1 4-hydroxybenzoate 3-monooxygenase [Brevibacterium sp. BRM-1]
MLAHLLRTVGIDAIVIDNRTREQIAHTHRAGILEHGSVALLTESGARTRVLTEGHRHDGIDVRVDGESHRIDFRATVGESVWLYPQNEVFADLAATADADGTEVHYGVADTVPGGFETDRPAVAFTDAHGVRRRIACDWLVGADGSRSACRRAVGEGALTRYFHEYPFAWFGILVQAPPSAPELIYARSQRGFALISQRSADVQRMYFQCDPGEDPAAWSDDRIWAELTARIAGPDGLALQTGPIFEKTVLPFRSTVTHPMRHGRLLLAGDAAHTVPPTGAKGLNLAFADVAVLFAALRAELVDGRRAGLDAYSATALERVWRAQSFSSWLTSMLHRSESASPFEEMRALGELRGVLASPYGRQYLAEAYTGWPRARARRPAGPARPVGAPVADPSPQQRPPHHQHSPSEGGSDDTAVSGAAV